MQKLIKNLLGHKKLLGISAIAYTLLLLYLSLGNVSDIPAPQFRMADKLWHFLAYMGLTVLWGAAFFACRKSLTVRTIIYIVAATISFGIIIEVLQVSMTDYRNADIYDALANSLGAVVSGIFLNFVKNQKVE